MYVFSTFVMRGLNRTGPVEAITAMRGINAEANSNPRSCWPTSVRRCWRSWWVSSPRSSCANPAAGGYWPAPIVGVLAAIITIAFNVPLNNHLDGVNPVGLSAADAAREWHAFFTTWTAWNHVRTVTAFVAAVLMLIGLRYR